MPQRPVVEFLREAQRFLPTELSKEAARQIVHIEEEEAARKTLIQKEAQVSE